MRVAWDLHDRLAVKAENSVSRFEAGECDEIDLLPACPAPFCSCLVPVNDSAAAAATTKISQRAMASQGRRVLQRPIDVGESRAAMKRMVRSGRGRQQPATRSSARYG